VADGGDVVAKKKKPKRAIRAIPTGTLSAVIREHWGLGNKEILRAVHAAGLTLATQTSVTQAIVRIRAREGDNPRRAVSVSDDDASQLALPAPAPESSLAGAPEPTIAIGSARMTKVDFVRPRAHLSNKEIFNQAEAFRPGWFRPNDVTSARWNAENSIGRNRASRADGAAPATGGERVRRKYTRRSPGAEREPSHDPILDSKLVALRRLILDVGLDNAQRVFEEYATVRDGIGGSRP